MTYRVLSLFAGIGGFDLGLERTGGFKTVAFCEFDKKAQAVLRKHWPEVPIYDDVRTLTGERLSADGVAVDVIVGGFPCQDISTAGAGAGIAEGTRSGLWFEFARLIGELRPRYVLVENVSALLGRGLDTVLGDLASLGYDAWWDCIPASAVGAPHRRDRIWLVAYPGHMRGARPEAGKHRATREYALQQDNWPKGAVAAVECCEDVADALSTGQSGSRTPRLGGNPAQSSEGQAAYAVNGGVGRFWAVEPGLGGGLDGFPDWLDRSVGRGLSYAESGRRAEVLRHLWSPYVSQALWRAAGGLERVSQAQVLFAFVREYEAGSDEARLLVEGAEASEAFLRSLREGARTGGAPHRSRQDQQRRGEHSDAVQSVSRLLARDSKAAWALRSWEDAVPRVASSIPGRVDRLKQLGNAVVPQIPELIGRAILAADAARLEQAA